jgi:phenylacetate-CoA ligase
VEVTDFYASEESGQMATRCPHSGQYHVAVESVLMEVLRPDDTPAEPGEIGRIVVTSLYNYALPLIRYEQDDLAEMPIEPCGCGRNLPTVKRILGRTRDMFVMPNGDRVFFRLSPSTMLALLPAIQCQAIQTVRDCVEIRYVWDGSDRVPDEAGLQAHIHKVIGPGIGLRIVQVDKIGRSPGGKFREFMSLVE